MSAESEIFRHYLKLNRLRWTCQRQTILQAFLATEGHVRAEELLDMVNELNASIGIATLYRTLNLLIQSGLARENTGPQGRNYERQYRRGHHDHLICTGCGQIVEFEHPLIEKFQLEVCRRHGFFMQSHRMELRGLCAACRGE